MAHANGGVGRGPNAAFSRLGIDNPRQVYEKDKGGVTLMGAGPGCVAHLRRCGGQRFGQGSDKLVTPQTPCRH